MSRRDLGERGIGWGVGVASWCQGPGTSAGWRAAGSDNELGARRLAGALLPQHQLLSLYPGQLPKVPPICGEKESLGERGECRGALSRVRWRERKGSSELLTSS